MLRSDYLFEFVIDGVVDGGLERPIEQTLLARFDEAIRVAAEISAASLRLAVAIDRYFARRCFHASDEL